MKRYFTSLFGAMVLVCGLVATLSAQTFKTDEQIEAMGYTHIYQLNIGNTVNYTNGAPYTINNSSANLGPIESVAYRLNLGTDNYVYASMGAYTSDLTKIGVPTFKSYSVQQRYVQNLYYEAKSPNLTTAGTTVNQGNIEFWPYNYGATNAAKIGGSSVGNTLYDFGDSIGLTRGSDAYDGAHGSMQVHDYQKNLTVFAFNHWNAGQQAGIGIGNGNTSSDANTDWTFIYNSASYSTKQLDVYAKPVFSQMSESDYSAISSEASNLKLVYKLDCPLYGTYSTNNYTVNNATKSDISGMPLSRVAYYMTLEKADGTVDYAYTSFDATTNDLSKIGMPFDGTTRQAKVTNMTVQSNVAGVVNGTGITTGNIEITNKNYSGTNALGIPNASDSTWDFGDKMETSGNYACFQVHNYGATNPDGTTGQTVMALNRWNGSATGTNNTIDIGIGNNTKAGQTTPTGSTDTLDYTFNGSWGTSSNASQYTNRSLYVLAEAAIAPGMANVKNASDYTVVQGARLSTQTLSLWNTYGVDYDIVDNVSQLKSEFGPIDRVGYYMEYAKTASDTLKYVFVSFDAQTDDISKLGVPTTSSGEYYQKVVHNLEITTNVTASDGKINDTKTGTQVAANTTISQSKGYLEFWNNSYATTKSSVISNGDGSKYDINDTPTNSNGHGSMQIHSLDTNQTLFAVNGFNTTKQFGIGTNPNSSGQPDWTFDSTKSSYEIANIYTFAKPVLSDMSAEQYAEIKSEAVDMHLVYKLDCPLQGTYSANNYTVNNASSVASALKGMPLRVGYYMKLEKSDGTVDYAYASYNSPTNDVTKIGLPFDGTVYQTKVTDLTVQSNVAGVVNGTGIKTGNIEMWNQCYNKNNTAGIDGASDYSYDFGDQPTNSGYGSFQIHNYGAQQTVMALNAWNGQAKGNTYIDIGIGNNPNTTDTNYQPDYTFNGQKGTNSNAAQYTSRTLYIMAEAAIAPGMVNVSDASDYTLVQGAQLTTQMNTNWQTGSVNYNIVDNLSTLQSQGVLFDRVGYYMEYATTTSDELKYVFVSFDAMTDDISKIGVPTASTGEFYQQTVNNLQITTNVPASQGLITDPDTGKQIAANTTISQDKGYIEFFSSNYDVQKGGVVSEGSTTIFDINDTPSGGAGVSGYGSMQIHSLESGQTIFALNNFGGTKAYGIGTNPTASTTRSNSQADWTFDSSKSGYAIANVYTYVHPVDALLTTQEYSLFQRDLFNSANVKLSGTWATTNGVEIKTIQASADDGETWTNLVINADGTFSGNMTLLGGLHEVQYQALDASGKVLATKSGQVGVGEIFITAGQSNSTNYGDACQTSTSGMAFSYNPDTGKWQLNTDPQQGPLDNSSRGSMWPSFADTLAAEEGVPVGTYSVGYGGTSLTQWLNDWKPGESDIGIYTNLKAAMEYLNENADGFAGILWHQGESDASAGTSEQAYYDMLTTLIARTREDSGIEDLPWGIAIASALSDGTTNSAITNAQKRVIEDDLMAFLGVNTDDFFATPELASLLRGQNGNSIHLSEDGLWLAGYLMAMSAGKDIAALHHTPEPSTWALLILGVAGLYWLKKRKEERGKRKEEKCMKWRNPRS